MVECLIEEIEAWPVYHFKLLPKDYNIKSQDFVTEVPFEVFQEYYDTNRAFRKSQEKLEKYFEEASERRRVRLKLY